MLRSLDIPHPADRADPPADLLRRVAALQAENKQLRRALTEERRAVDILLAIVDLADAELAGRCAN